MNVLNVVPVSNTLGHNRIRSAKQETPGLPMGGQTLFHFDGSFILAFNIRQYIISVRSECYFVSSHYHKVTTSA